MKKNTDYQKFELILQRDHKLLIRFFAGMGSCWIPKKSRSQEYVHGHYDGFWDGVQYFQKQIEAFLNKRKIVGSIKRNKKR